MAWKLTSPFLHNLSLLYFNRAPSLPPFPLQAPEASRQRRLALRPPSCKFRPTLPPPHPTPLPPFPFLRATFVSFCLSCACRYQKLAGSGDPLSGPLVASPTRAKPRDGSNTCPFLPCRYHKLAGHGDPLHGFLVASPTRAAKPRDASNRTDDGYHADATPPGMPNRGARKPATAVRTPSSKKIAVIPKRL